MFFVSVLISCECFQWTCVILATLAVTSGNGQHMDTLSPEQKEGAIFYTILNFPFGIVAFGIPKLAVVSLLTRVLNTGRRHKIFLWVLSGSCLLVLLGCVPLLYCQVTPTRAQWDPNVEVVSALSPWVLVDYAISVGGMFCSLLEGGVGLH